MIIMKKLFTLLLSSMVILASAALAATPQVVLTAPSDYDVSIDGRMYNPNPSTVINNLAAGTHTVEVYRVTSNGIFGLGKKRELLRRQQFNLRNSDVNINVDQSGRLRISNSGYNDNDNKRDDRNNDGRYGNRDRNDDDRDDDRYDNRDNKDRYGKSEGKGRGHKYGHYKKDKKNKKHKNKKHDDNKREDDNR
jgi:type 1 fimbria pilin